MNDDAEEQPRGSKRKQREAPHDDAAMSDETKPQQSANGDPPPAPTPPALKLRNYRPKDKSIAYQTLPRPSYSKGQPVRNAPPHASLRPSRLSPQCVSFACAWCVDSDAEWLDSELAGIVRSAMAADSEALLAIAPQSVNSDLKRDIAPQLAILKRQTRQALQQIISQPPHSTRSLLCPRPPLKGRCLTHNCVLSGCAMCDGHRRASRGTERR